MEIKSKIERIREYGGYKNDIFNEIWKMEMGNGGDTTKELKETKIE